jgi:hypothetical protein
VNGSRPPNLQAVAERHAPLVVLDKQEELFPTSAEDFIANCDLVWVTKPGKVTRVVDSVDPAHLAADAYTSPVAQWRGTTVPASFHTRPFASRLRQPPGLPPRRGWALSLQDIDTAVGTKSTAAQPDVYEGAPVYFEWTARDGHCYLTYWFCYAGSGLPFDVAEAVKATHDPGGALLTGAPDDASASSALQALAVAHPDLYLGRPPRCRRRRISEATSCCSATRSRGHWTGCATCSRTRRRHSGRRAATRTSSAIKETGSRWRSSTTT